MNKLTRRKFITATTAAGIGLSMGSAQTNTTAKPAVLGGKPVRTEPFPSWPMFTEAEEHALLNTLRSRQWFRGSGKNVNEFEAAFGKLMGARYCIATSSGTTALIASMNALGVGAGDEVLLPTYTFVACVNAILMLGAVPVFVDVNRETFQIDATRLEAAITDRTAAIMPVHIGGNPADLDAILLVAKRYRLAVVEDACQGHLAEWKGKKVGTYGDAGCFSFQASKNLTAGEGGAILTDNDDLADRCFAAANQSRPRKTTSRPNLIRGANFRMSEFHASILLMQMLRLPEQAKTREENAAYLSKLLSDIPGIIPARRHDGCTRNAHHLYMFRYAQEKFAGLPRAKFINALTAEGIRVSSGYTPLNKEPFIAETLQSPEYQRAMPRYRFAQWNERNVFPRTDKLCEEAVWFTQNMLLGSRESMEQIAEAMRKIQVHAGELVKV